MYPLYTQQHRTVYNALFAKKNGGILFSTNEEVIFIPNKNCENLRKLFKKGTNPGQWNANGNPAWEICGHPFQWNANGNPDWESFGNPVQWNALHGKAALLRK